MEIAREFTDCRLIEIPKPVSSKISTSFPSSPPVRVLSATIAPNEGLCSAPAARVEVEVDVEVIVVPEVLKSGGLRAL
jgi:hypothetical protein